MSLAIAGVSAFAKKGHGQKKPKPEQLNITEVLVTFNEKTEVSVPVNDGSDLAPCGNGDDMITILGDNFDNGDTPVVMPGNHPDGLVVCEWDAYEIVVQCPYLEKEGSGTCKVGDYRLTVRTGKKKERYGKHDLTIGAVGPQGEEGLQGEEGPAGAQGAPGVSGYEIVSRVRELSLWGGWGITVTAFCPDPKVPLGGGCPPVDPQAPRVDPNDVVITADYPFTSGTPGWECKFTNQGAITATGKFTTYAICADALVTE